MNFQIGADKITCVPKSSSVSFNDKVELFHINIEVLDVHNSPRKQRSHSEYYCIHRNLIFLKKMCMYFTVKVSCAIFMKWISKKKQIPL